MNIQKSQKITLLVDFIFAMLITMGMLYGASAFFIWMFPIQSAGFNLHVMMPIWFMIGVRSCTKNTLNKISFSQQQHTMLKMCLSAIIIAWMYYAFRSLYSPKISALYAFGMIGVMMASERLGALLAHKKSSKKESKAV